MNRSQAQLKKPPDASTGDLGRWLRASTVLAAVGLLALAAERLLDPATLPITQLHVEGEFRQLTPELLERLVSSQVRGGFFSIDVEAVRRALLSKPWVNDVTVRRVWPDTLQVTVFEQRAFAYWGAMALLNIDGVPFYPEPETFPEGLVHLDGPVGSERLVMQRFLDVDAMVSSGSSQIVELYLSERRAWRFILSNETHVLLGQGDFDRRLQRFSNALHGFLKERLDTMATVDLRYPNGFAVRRRVAAGAGENGERV